MSKRAASKTVQLEAEIVSLRSRIAELERYDSEDRAARQKLADKEAFNFALFQYNPVWTVVVDTEGRVVKSNRAKINSGDRLPNIGDVMYRDYASHHETDMYRVLMECIGSGKSDYFPELRYGNKVLSITISPFPRGAIITSQDITAQKTAELDRMKLIDKLQQALAEVETLRGLLPICAYCKKIRDDKGYWNHIEAYLGKHAHTEFTHTMCPECVKQFYPDLWQKMENGKNAAHGIKAQ
jgi:hypothetical protein